MKTVSTVIRMRQPTNCKPHCALRKVFGAYELDIDRISDQLSDAELDRFRSTIRGQGKLLDDLLFELLFPSRPSRATHP